MPTYNYKCLDCGEGFVVFQSMSDKHLSNCNICESNNVEKLISAGSGLIFKGSGFYLTDYKSSLEVKNKLKKKNKKKE